MVKHMSYLIAVLSLAVTLTMSNFTLAAEPLTCPTVDSIQKENFIATKAMDGLYDVINCKNSLCNYGTNHSWGPIGFTVKAVSSDDAVRQVKDNLASLVFLYGPTSGYSFCHYKTNKQSLSIELVN
jgi:hypothetical protein